MGTGWPPVAWGRGCLFIGNSDKPFPEGEEQGVGRGRDLNHSRPKGMVGLLDLEAICAIEKDSESVRGFPEPGYGERWPFLSRLRFQGPMLALVRGVTDRACAPSANKTGLFPTERFYMHIYTHIQ